MRDLSYQLYSSRNFPPVSDTLALLAGLGYTQVEGYRPLFETEAALAETRAALTATRLSMPSAHMGLDMLARPDAVLAIAETLGLKLLVAPYLDVEDRPKDAGGWAEFGLRLAALAAPYWDAGLHVGWHNHDFEFQDINGQFPIDLILDADPRLVLELDIAWVVRAGQSAEQWMAKHADRIKALHLKDIAAPGQNMDEDGWADIGHGTLDWAGLIGAAEQTGAEFLIVEHDNPSDHRRFASRSFATLQEV